jgi:hypothetical protein
MVIELATFRLAAGATERLVHTVPEHAPWFTHIASSGALRHVEVVDAWAGAPGSEVDARS